MKKGNKGYTLVELLLSLAVFSIVMLVIGSMISSTSAVYKNESFEITMQEDASLVIAQIDELLMDATSFSGAGPYTITNNGTPYQISLAGNELRVSSDGGTTYEVISDCILVDPSSPTPGFQIKGFSQTVGSSDWDNTVLVSIDFEKSGYTYHTEKQVYFRNDLENVNSSLITSIIGGDSGESGSTTPVCDVKRYAIVDLNTYSEDGDWVFEGTTGNYTYFTYCNSNGSTYTSGPKRYIKLVESVNKSHTTSVSKSDNIKIKNNSKEVYLTIDAVEFTYGSGVLVLPAIKSNHGGLEAFEVKGLDLYALNKAHPGDSKVQVIFYHDDDNDMTFDDDENKVHDDFASYSNSSRSTYVGFNSDNESYYNMKSYETLKDYYFDNGLPKFEGTSFEFFKLYTKICSDQMGRGYAINYTENLELHKYGMDDLDDGKFRILIKFDLKDAPEDSVTHKKKIYCVDFQTYCAGNEMNNKKGGKTYTEWK